MNPDVRKLRDKAGSSQHGWLSEEHEDQERIGFNVSIFFNKLAQTRDHLAALRQELQTGFASQEFILLDESGAKRGSLTSTGGRGVLTLLDSQGNVRIMADAGEKQPSLEFLSEDGQPMVSLP